MTIRIPPENFLDKLLKLLGKERKVIAPDGIGKIFEKMGPFVQVKLKRQSWIKAMFRKKE
jgi:hypothetical protein